jgi:hypothetical protein
MAGTTEPPTRRLLSPSARTRVGYLVAGVALGALWLVNGGRSVWEHALRLLVLVLVVATVLELLRRRRGGARTGSRRAYVRLLTAKLALIGLAFAAEALLAHWSVLGAAGAEDVVALALALAVAVGGPMLHERLTAPAAPSHGN